MGSTCKPIDGRLKLQFHDQITLLNLLKSCQKEKSILKVRKIHADLLKRYLITKDVYIASALITTYAKCGAMEKAKEVFEQLEIQNIVTWNSLISGYAQCGRGDEALNFFRKMQDSGVRPSTVTFISVLKACGIAGSLNIGEDIHAEVRKRGLLQKDIVIGTALVDMYSKCGVLEKAEEVFKNLPVRNVVSWNTLISGYAQHGLGHEALKCYRQMQNAGFCPNAVTYIGILKACGIVGSLDIGEEIDAKIREQGLFQKDLLLGTALVDMYSKCLAMDKARKVFEELPMRDVVSWNTMISGYVQHGLGDEALKCFRQMQNEGVCEDVVTYICILKACGIVGSIEIGDNIVAKVRKQGLLLKDTMLGTAAVDMYSKCSALKKAREIFDELPTRDVVSWSALITGYTQHGHGWEALKCFQQMQDDGVCPDVATYICILKVCGITGSLEIGKDVDCKIRKQGLLMKDIMLGNALVEMYSGCGALAKAKEVFEQLPTRNVASWNAIITGYAQYGYNDEAFICFRHMQDMGVCPNAVTYICILKTCGIVGSLQIGNDIDTEVRKQGLLQKDLMLGNTLVGMYSKCCAMEKAYEVFDQLPAWDVVSWNALVSGYGQLGQANEVFVLYRKMMIEGVLPNLVTFIILLTACSHAGLVEEGEKLFNEMCAVCSLTPTEEHYSCMIDLFGRAGDFDKAKALLEKVPHLHGLLLLQSILGACRKWTNVTLGKWAFEQSIQLNVQCATTYVCMENIYSTNGM